MSKRYAGGIISSTQASANGIFGTQSFLQGTVGVTLGSTTGPAISNVQYLAANNTVITGDVAVSTLGGNVLINGTNFTSGSLVYVNGLQVSNTFVSSSQIIAVCPPNTGNVSLSIFSSTSNVGGLGPNIQYDVVPVWTTSAISINNGLTVSVSLVVTSDSTLTYTLFSGTLPTGLSLSSSGVISGTVTGYTTNTVVPVTILATNQAGQSTQQVVNITILANDPNFSSDVLFIAANAPTSANTVITDLSANNLQLTPVGTVRAQNFSPYTAGYYSYYFPGNGNYLYGSNSLLNISSTTVAWTFECWVNPVASGGYFFAIGSGSSYGNSLAATYGAATANKFTFSQGNGSSNPVNFTSTNTYAANTWYHYAVTRTSAGVITQYINGVADGTQTYNSATLAAGTTFVINGLYDNNGLGNNGGNYYVSNLRFVINQALYTSNFTPSTTPLTAVANTVLLTCQSNRFIDNGLNNTMTANASPKVVSANPFASQYVANTPYYSTQFNGSTDYLTYTPSTSVSFGTNNFTIEAWVYPTTTPTTQIFLDARNSSITNTWAIGWGNGNASTGQLCWAGYTGSKIGRAHV